MSDLATQYEDGVFEPDEETLISALRNQDDIPILMDIVAEKESLSASQEAHLAHSLGESREQGSKSQEALGESVAQEASTDDVVILDDVVADSTFSQELIAKTIADVLEKRLPELVSEVMQTLQATGKTQKE